MPDGLSRRSFLKLAATAGAAAAIPGCEPAARKTDSLRRAGRELVSRDVPTYLRDYLL